jgi:hypothetical protein
MSPHAEDRSRLAPPCVHRTRLATFYFDPMPGADGLTSAACERFSDDFDHEFARLRDWSARQSWPRPTPMLEVWVSGRYAISKSLVPAWYGRAGHMEFPASRVIARNAAILHELVHVLHPNGNRLLAEGLAIYLQALIGGNPAFPNFGRPLHVVARERLQSMIPEFARGDVRSLDPLQLTSLECIATPAPLALRVGSDLYGEEPRGQGRLYPLAGSFVQALIETHGLEKFRALYQRTPLVPSQHNAGAQNRWIEVYGSSFADLEREWKLLMVSDAADA